MLLMYSVLQCDIIIAYFYLKLEKGYSQHSPSTEQNQCYVQCAMVQFQNYVPFLFFIFLLMLACNARRARYLYKPQRTP